MYNTKFSRVDIYYKNKLVERCDFSEYVKTIKDLHDKGIIDRFSPADLRLDFKP